MIIEGEAARAYVSTPLYNFGEVKKDQVLDFSIDWMVDPNQIDYIQRGCGCTRVYYEDNKIKGTLDMNKAGRFEASGKTPVTKSFSIFLKDGEPHFVGDPTTKEFKLNDKKQNIRVNLYATVVVSDAVAV